MIIDQLPEISLPVQDTDEIAIERGQLTYKASLSGLNKVSKSGDTMTGNLAIKNTAYDGADTPSPPSYERTTFTDKNNKSVAFVGSVIGSQSNGVQLGGAITLNDNYIENLLGLYVSKTGQRSVVFSEPAIWQAALGITAINTFLARILNSKPLFVRAKRTYSNITFNSSGYAQIDTLANIATALSVPELASDLWLVGMMIQGFSTGDVYGLARGSTPNTIYAIGKPNTTISSFGVQYDFVNSTIETHP